MLSAYLDGELTESQRAEVEAFLAADAEARQLLEELRATVAGLRSLPRTKVSDDFADSLRAHIERRALLGNASLRRAPRVSAAPSMGRRMAAAAVIALAVTAGYVTWSFTRETQQPGEQYAFKDDRGEPQAPSHKPQATPVLREKTDQIKPGASELRRLADAAAKPALDKQESSGEKRLKPPPPPAAAPVQPADGRGRSSPFSTGPREKVQPAEMAATLAESTVHAEGTAQSRSETETAKGKEYHMPASMGGANIKVEAPDVPVTTGPARNLVAAKKERFDHMDRAPIIPYQAADQSTQHDAFALTPAEQRNRSWAASRKTAGLPVLGPVTAPSPAAAPAASLHMAVSPPTRPATSQPASRPTSAAITIGVSAAGRPETASQTTSATAPAVP
ncbi:MAG TPA: hypothetical protein VLM89_08325 [Phycisphaerae bacterium]|nr:hypothetical protein [Phycisphaerae bacterium]